MPNIVNASGGTYVLKDPVTGQVMRTGRTGNLAQRKVQHASSPITKGLDFEVDLATDDYNAQRVREQIVHDLYNPPLNKIRPIRPNHPNRDIYLARLCTILYALLQAPSESL
jgi:hypothetical protein